MQEPTIEGFSLSPPQKHLWNLREDETSCAPAGCRVRIDGPLDPSDLASALSAAVAEHEVLRTGFAVLPGTRVPMQVIHDPAPIEPEVHDLGDAAPQDQEREAEARFAELTARPFPLAPAGGPALRAVLLRLAPDRHELHVAAPALCADDTALWNLVRLVAAKLAGSREDGGDADDEAMQYADLAEWQREMFESEEAPEGLGFWRRIDLSGLAAAHLSLELPEHGDGAFLPRSLPLEIPTEATEAAAALARDAGVPLEAVRLAAWQAVLGRLAEDDGLVVGVTSEGRAFQGLDRALGLFQKVLPVSLGGGEEDFRARVERAAAALEAAREWHELWDLERMSPNRSLAFLPYAFAARAAREPVAAGGRTITLVERHPHGERYRLKLVFDELAGASRAAIHYDPRSFDEDAVACIADQFATFFANACRQPATAVARIEALSAAWSERLTGELSHDGSAPEPRVERIDDFLAEHARTRGDASAVVADGQSLDYATLDLRANRLARELATLGVGPGSFVGIHMSRSVDMIVAIAGILRAGGAYLPLPPAYPAERVAFMLEDTGAPVVVTRKADADTLPAGSAKTILLDELRDDATTEPLQSPAGADDPAYVIYTSGSTGRPKGVPISHANLVRSNAARAVTYEHAPGRYLLLSSFAFDSSVAGIFWTLESGGTLVLPEEGTETDVATLRDWIVGQSVTHTLCLPSLWSVLLESIPAEELSSLATVIVAGESCPKDLVQAHLAKLPHVQLFNEYGPTEGTVWSTVHDCSRPNPRPTVPIGRPVPGASVFVLDEERRPAPVGIAGELFLGGPGIARGYLARPELTAERFVESPFSLPQSDGRLYRTGDLARFLPDGAIEFLGRVDHQVKIRGHRIELEEIDSVLQGHPSVEEAVVHAREDRPGDQRLVAYVVGSGVDATALRAYLAESLPDYMVPAHFVPLDEMPRLPNGKVDRKALPAPAAGESGASAAYEAPRDALETVLCGIWSEVLGVERVGIQDDFFELGGHSILATQLFARIVDTLQVRISLRTLFDHRTVAQLVEDMRSDPAEATRLERTAEILLELLASDDGE